MSELAIALAAVIVTVIVAFYNFTLAHDKVSYELIRDFNKRYDELNNDLRRLQSKEKDGELTKLTELNSRETVLLDDYLNLCAEEYYWYLKGRIPPKVWDSWYGGMKSWYKEIKLIRKKWKDDTYDDNEVYNPKVYYCMNEDFFKDFETRKTWFGRLFVK